MLCLSFSFGRFSLRNCVILYKNKGVRFWEEGVGEKVLYHLPSTVPCQAGYILPGLDSTNYTHLNIYCQVQHNMYLKVPKSEIRSSEMEFLKKNCSRGFWAKTRFFSHTSFCLVFYPYFTCIQNIFMNRFFCFKDFLFLFLKQE
jgi:hypothetical protein